MLGKNNNNSNLETVYFYGGEKKRLNVKHGIRATSYSGVLTIPSNVIPITIGITQDINSNLIMAYKGSEALANVVYCENGKVIAQTSIYLPYIKNLKSVDNLNSITTIRANKGDNYLQLIAWVEI